MAPKKINQLKYHITDLIHENGKHVIKGTGPNIRTYFVYNVVTKKKPSAKVSADMDIDVRLQTTSMFPGTKRNRSHCSIFHGLMSKKRPPRRYGWIFIPQSPPLPADTAGIL